MSNKIQNELDELVENNIISAEIAHNINRYFETKENQAPSKILIIFGVLGALLGGLGIILVFAHNWDKFSTFTKSCISLLPLAIGQIATAYSLLKKPNQKAWTEASSVFLFCAVGASMALISQVYNIPGNFEMYVLTWMLLCLPLVYLLNSSVVSLFYIIGITVYAVSSNTGYFSSSTKNYWYILLLLGIIPHYYQLIKKSKDSNFTAFHNWFLPISISIALVSIIANKSESFVFISFVALFSCFYLIGKTQYFETKNKFSNGWLYFGKLASLYILFMGSFRNTWEELITKKMNFNDFAFFTSIILCLIASTLLYLLFKNKKTSIENVIQFSIPVTLLSFALGFIHVIIPVVIINAYVLYIGVQEIMKGNTINSIARMNYGILIIAILILCRFFDTEMSFVVRGLLFIVVGFGFFFLNYTMIKKRNKATLNQPEKN